MVRVATVQMADSWRSTAEARAAAVSGLEEAARLGAQLAVLPELCTLSYDFTTRSQVLEGAEGLDGPTVRSWLELARATGLTVVGGLAELDGDRLYNSAVVVGPAGVLGTYRKAHLFHYERQVFTAGDDAIGIVDTPHGRIGLLICYDLRFAESFRIGVLRGMRMLCVPTTWNSRGKPRPWDERGWCGQNYLVAGYAYANRVWIAVADRAGRDGATQTLGCSGVFDPHGYPAAGPAGADRAEVLVADVDLDAVPTLAATHEMSLLADRRPDLYGELVAPLDPPGRDT